MAERVPPLALRALLLVAALAMAGCPGPGAATCNADGDCAAEQRCSLGLCVPGTSDDGDAGPVDAGDELDAGEVDSGVVEGPDAGPQDAGLDAGVDAGGAPDSGPVDAGGCGPGDHDGGDGACVPEGSCSPGFALYYVDEDGDGVGAGELSGDCAALPLQLGRSDVDSDCAPLDGARFALQTGFDESDGDGYTAGPAQSCIGDVPEQGIVAEPRGPPLLAVASAASSSGPTNTWGSTSSAMGCCGGTTAADIDPAAATATLVLNDFDCLVAPQRVDRVRVRARVRLPLAAFQPQELTVSAALILGGASSTARTATSTWQPNTFTLVEVEGTLPDWGLVNSDGAALCDGTLDAQVVVLPNDSYGGNVEIDYVVVEVLGDEDCAPADPALYSPQPLYGDSDDDTYFGGTSLASCVGDGTREVWDALWGDDCDDTDADAHPGQSSYFTSQRNGGGWDYNCNGTDEKRSVHDATGCIEDAAAPGTCVETGSASRTGDCGQQVSADSCPAAPPCTLVSGTARVACR